MVRNENVLQFDPLSLVLAIVLPFALLRGRAVRDARTLSKVIAGFAVLGLVMKVVPIFNQVNGEVIALTLPAHVVVLWAVLALTAELAPAPQRASARAAVATRSAA
jgi:uncharacterized membrane protein